MGLFGVDTNKVSQTSTQQQVGVQTGDAYGAASGRGSVGGGARGNITGTVKVGAGGTLNITDSGAFDVANSALASNAAVTMAALQENQKLSTLAVGYANANANQALSALQAIGTQAQVAAAGGSAAEVAGATTTTAETTGKIVDTSQLLILAGLLVGGFIFYRYAK